MQEYNIDKDIQLLCVRAISFPAGIAEAFAKLHELLPDAATRASYGISHGSPDGIIYMAAAEEQYPGEAAGYGCETFIISKGTYMGRVVNWKENPAEIGATFQQLLADKRIDPNGACVEKYFNNSEAQCMVRLVDAAD